MSEGGVPVIQGPDYIEVTVGEEATMNITSYHLLDLDVEVTVDGDPPTGATFTDHPTEGDTFVLTWTPIDMSPVTLR